MAQVIGRPGLDALRKSQMELTKARVELDKALREGHPYGESELDAVTRAFDEPRSWLEGAQGECRTAAVLDALPQHFVVFHDFHARSASGEDEPSNIDHIVVGPPGVFVIDSKNTKALLVESSDSSPMTGSHLEAVRRQALDVRRWIAREGREDLARVFVRGIVTYAVDGVEVECPSERSVWLLPLSQLMSRLLNEPDTLTFDQVARISKVLSEHCAAHRDEVTDPSGS